MMRSAVFAGALCAAALSLASTASAEEMVATVNGKGISKNDFDRNWESYIRQRGIPGGHAGKEGSMNEFRGQLLDILIDQELLFQEAVKTGHEATKEQIGAEVEKAGGQFPSSEDFEKALSQSGLTLESYSDFLKRRISVQNLVVEEIASTATVSDEEVGAFYKENQAKFESPEEVRARHILIKVDPGADEAAKEEARKKIEGVIEEAKGGGDFAELARKYSEGPTGPKGGDLGFFGRGRMVPPFEEAAFSLAPGDVSGPVLTQFGWHAIKVEEKKEARTVPLDEASVQISSFLKDQKVNEAVLARIKNLREKATIEKQVDW